MIIFWLNPKVLKKLCFSFALLELSLLVVLGQSLSFCIKIVAFVLFLYRFYIFRREVWLAGKGSKTKKKRNQVRVSAVGGGKKRPCSLTYPSTSAATTASPIGFIIVSTASLIAEETAASDSTISEE